MTGRVVAWLYGDLVCPWSYLALGRLRRLEARLPVTVGWRPLRRGTGTSEATDPGPELEALGLPYRPPAVAPDSTDALRAVEFAIDLGPTIRDRVLDGLFRAHFSGAVRLDDRASLLEACEALGLDREGLAAAIEDGRYDAQLSGAEQEADRYGIEVLPGILLGKRKVVGAAPMKLLAELARQALSEA